MANLRVSVGATVLMTAVILAVSVGDAHKPITSPFTFNDDVFPIVRARCSGCHLPDGVAPMSLMSHADAVPWGESIRAELIAGHMPPWPVESPRDRFRNAGALSARELNVLLTWASGGTPLGDPARAPEPVSIAHDWPLGRPDVELALPPFTMPADQQEQSVSLLIPTRTTELRHLRAIDLRPGTPAVVRSARISIRTESTAAGGPSPTERWLALWTPGEPPIAIDGAGFDLPAGAQLSVQIRYKKTWQYERREMADKSSIGLYFASLVSSTVRTLETKDGLQLDADVRAIAIYPDPDLSGVRASVEIARPDGSHQELIALRARPEWSRRYWFAGPIALPKGTRYSVRYTPLDDGSKPSPPETRRMFVDVITER